MENKKGDYDMGTKIHYKDFFEAAHRLPNTPPDHRCHKTHGHTYLVTLFFKGQVHEHYGWIIDFADIETEWFKVKADIDHTYLNETLHNPTAERIAEYIFKEIKPALNCICAVEVCENQNVGATYAERH